MEWASEKDAERELWPLTVGRTLIPQISHVNFNQVLSSKGSSAHFRLDNSVNKNHKYPSRLAEWLKRWRRCTRYNPLTMAVINMWLSQNWKLKRSFFGWLFFFCITDKLAVNRKTLIHSSFYKLLSTVLNIPHQLPRCLEALIKLLQAGLSSQGQVGNITRNHSINIWRND